MLRVWAKIVKAPKLIVKSQKNVRVRNLWGQLYMGIYCFLFVKAKTTIHHLNIKKNITLLKISLRILVIFYDVFNILNRHFIFKSNKNSLLNKQSN